MDDFRSRSALGAGIFAFASGAFWLEEDEIPEDLRAAAPNGDLHRSFIWLLINVSNF